MIVNLLPFHLHYKTDNRLLTVNFSIDDMAKILQNLDPNKAHGQDKISIRILQLCGNSVFKSLELIFKQSMESVFLFRLNEKRECSSNS